MPGPFYPILGIQAGRGPNGHVPVRLEVDDWWKSKKPIHISQHSLAIHALNYMYDEMSPFDKLSYYQIAGIHNQPIVPWDDAPFENKNYCMHSSPNFPTWHRPYVALLEQVMYETMVNKIIPKFHHEDQKELRDAADQWRFPFWDWASKKPQAGGGPPNYDVPLIIADKHVEVRTPEGHGTVLNPFWGFRMKDGVPMGDPKLGPNIVTREPYTRSAGTSRHAYVEGAKEETAYDEAQEVSGINNNQGVRDELQQWKWEAGGSLTGSLRDWFYRILLILPYPQFATKKADVGAGKMTSCEDIHDVLHDWGGGSFGHMGAPAVGAMDPLFWFHHCNVDRMLDLWAGLHPAEGKDWLEKDPDAVLPLIPFRSNQYGDYLNGRDCWETEFFGYTYPETKKWTPEHTTDGVFDEKKMAAELAIKLNKKYNSAAQAQKKAMVTTTREAASDKPITHPDVSANDVAPTIDEQLAGAEVKGVKITTLAPGQDMHDLIPDVLTTYDYIANVTYEKYALDGHPFTIRFYIGNVPKAKGRAAHSGALTQVGEIYNFCDPVEFDKGGCANCAKQKRERIQSSGSVALTNPLLTRHKQQIPHDHETGDKHFLASMNPEDVIPFLVKHFHWRVTDREGQIIDKTRISSLKVSVAMGSANHHKDPTKLSEFSDYKILYDITKGAESGTGAHPDDNLFPGHDGLHLSDLANKGVGDLKKGAADAKKVGESGAKSAQSAAKGASDKAAEAAKGLGKAIGIS